MTPAEHAIWTSVYSDVFVRAREVQPGGGDVSVKARQAASIAIEAADEAVDAFRTFEPIVGEPLRAIETLRAVRGR